eukprot:scaffold155209_cov18-Tisochrysis_lutea.AAC.2
MGLVCCILKRWAARSGELQCFRWLIVPAHNWRLHHVCCIIIVECLSMYEAAASRVQHSKTLSNGITGAALRDMGAA